MEFNIREYGKMMDEKNISIIYSGPIWAGGIDGMAEMLMKRLAFDELDESASQSVFSVFVEQMNNMLLYSADKEYFTAAESREVSKGIYVLGFKNGGYFVQTGNIVKEKNARVLRDRIDYLNLLDKVELRALYRKKIRGVNDDTDSKGAGIGLIEIARRAAEPIEYMLEPMEDGYKYFTMYVSIRRGGRA